MYEKLIRLGRDTLILNLCVGKQINIFFQELLAFIVALQIADNVKEKIDANRSFKPRKSI